jgi:beta-1,3-galactosyltransferase 1
MTRNGEYLLDDYTDESALFVPAPMAPHRVFLVDNRRISNKRYIPPSLQQQQQQQQQQQSQQRVETETGPPVANPMTMKQYGVRLDEPGLCNGSVFLLVYVHTAPLHHKKRMLIRDTWGNPQNYPDTTVRLVFMLGKTADKSTQDLVSLESERYRDIVQGDFLDTYRNLTYKAVMALGWASKYCSHADYVLKSDDDVLVNMFALIRHLKSMQRHGIGTRGLLLCNGWDNMKVIRTKKSKWYVSESEYRHSRYPSYCAGAAYVQSSDVISAMYRATFEEPFFWIDDLYITGLLAKRLGIKHQKFNSVYVLNPKSFMPRFGKHATLVFGHAPNVNSIRIIWNRLLKEEENNKKRAVVEFKTL